MHSNNLIMPSAGDTYEHMKIKLSKFYTHNRLLMLSLQKIQFVVSLN